MGRIKHHAIVVTSFNPEHLGVVRQKAIEISNSVFSRDPVSCKGEAMITEVVSGLINSQYTFMVAPDGSKEGWDTSDLGDEFRRRFLDFIDQSDFYCDFAEICFGGDDDYNEVVRYNLEETE